MTMDSKCPHNSKVYGFIIHSEVCMVKLPCSILTLDLNWSLWNHHGTRRVPRDGSGCHGRPTLEVIDRWHLTLTTGSQLFSYFF